MRTVVLGVGLLAVAVVGAFLAGCAEAVLARRDRRRFAQAVYVPRLWLDGVLVRMPKR